MIQRVQSIYLLGVIIFSIVMCFITNAVYPVANLSNEFVELYIYNIYKISASSLFLMILIVILNVSIFILSLFALFQYKNRVLQLKLTAFAFLFNAILIIFAYWITDRLASEFQSVAHYRLGLLFPLLNVILLLLTSKAIKKDEAKVRAADRLR